MRIYINMRIYIKQTDKPEQTLEHVERTGEDRQTANTSNHGITSLREGLQGRVLDLR